MKTSASNLKRLVLYFSQEAKIVSKEMFDFADETIVKEMKEQFNEKTFESLRKELAEPFEELKEQNGKDFDIIMNFDSDYEWQDIAMKEENIIDKAFSQDEDFKRLATKIMSKYDDSRERSLALTKLEESYLWLKSLNSKQS